MSAGRAEGATDAGEKVQKLIARAGVASRRAAEEMIRSGRVTVNGRVIELGERARPDVDAVKVDGKLLRPLAQHRYLLLNKPAGYITARREDSDRPTVLDLVPPSERKALFPVGRLDYHTEGLLLLTTDGELAQRVAHPRHGCTKRYEVKVKGVPAAEAVDRLRRGIALRGRRTAPCRITALRRSRGARLPKENTWWSVELGEGRTRQIREMFHGIGHPVQRLRRVAIGPLSDRRLPSGACRPLSDEEVERLRRAAGGERRTGPPKRRRRR
jgi:23S rRNA pseudouridine2605 synthase